ncbi:hydrogenase maturation protease [Geomonas sp.]|uniref:hydrogenase maturation protease n=1 Tax=Geomonas sp. TaxID=2651584 RepID=UPI002B477370|nr:hydrogenase maturation protease [Geomonas sp.]HJV33682.1 hydrogenase maturation protease [Geomonas sp.]
MERVTRRGVEDVSWRWQGGDDPLCQRRRVLVAGIGNGSLGDEAFGIEVVERLRGHSLPDGTELCDFEGQGINLAYALVGGYDAAILVDVVSRGGQPGSLYVFEPNPAAGDTVPLEYHKMTPLVVIGLARLLGSLPSQLLIVACEPTGSSLEAMSNEMTPDVAAAVEPAVKVVAELACRLSCGTAPAHQWHVWKPARWR